MFLEETSTVKIYW